MSFQPLENTPVTVEMMLRKPLISAFQKEASQPLIAFHTFLTVLNTEFQPSENSFSTLESVDLKKPKMTFQIDLKKLSILFQVLTMNAQMSLWYLTISPAGPSSSGHHCLAKDRMSFQILTTKFFTSFQVLTMKAQIWVWYFTMTAASRRAAVAMATNGFVFIAMVRSFQAMTAPASTGSIGCSALLSSLVIQVTTVTIAGASAMKIFRIAVSTAVACPVSTARNWANNPMIFGRTGASPMTRVLTSFAISGAIWPTALASTNMTPLFSSTVKTWPRDFARTVTAGDKATKSLASVWSTPEMLARTAPASWARMPKTILMAGSSALKAPMMATSTGARFVARVAASWPMMGIREPTSLTSMVRICIDGPMAGAMADSILPRSRPTPEIVDASWPR